MKSEAAVIGYGADRDSVQKLVVYFQLDSSSICWRALGNELTRRSLCSLLSIDTTHLDTLVVRSYASPFEEEGRNGELTQRRTEEVSTYLRQVFPHVQCVTMVPTMPGTSWVELRERIAYDQAMPNREEALILIDYHRKNPVAQRLLLKRLNGGKPYRCLTNRILPTMQRTEIEIRRKRLLYADVSPLGELPSLLLSGLVPPSRLDSLGREFAAYSQPPKRITVLALKSNLLYDLALTPNVEVELPLGQAWSVNAECQFPWWLNTDRDFCYQLLSGGVELRRWLGKRQARKQLTGHFVGVYGGGGYYDLQWGGDGYQGDSFLTSGVTYGYGKSIARGLSLEGSVGLGFLTTDYLKYTLSKGALVWQATGRHTYWGPTKAKISLVWHLSMKRHRK